MSFSEHVLARAADRLGVVRLKGVHWSDLGSFERLLAILRRFDRRPGWLDALALPIAG